jgi:sugar/nucleoside kinase (ribokinase family)
MPSMWPGLRAFPVSFALNFRGNLWSAEGAGSVHWDLIPLADIVFAGGDEAAIAVGAGTRPSLPGNRRSAADSI